MREISSGEVVESGDSTRECHPPARIISPAAASSFLGGFGVALTAAFAHSSSLTSDLCRPFAAHCIGYPVATLGFGLKTYFRYTADLDFQFDVPNFSIFNYIF